MLEKAQWKVLDYLTLAEKPVFVSEIARKTGLGKSSVSRALKVLKDYDFLKCSKRGSAVFCEVDRGSPALVRIRVALNLIEIEPKITVLKKFSNKIVLFGSCSNGTDTNESDIDLLVVTSEKTRTIKATQNIKFSRPAQWVLKTPQEYIILNNKEPVFAEELAKGITLWGRHEITA